MKNTILIIIAVLLLSSCGSSNEEKLISDYAQTLGETKLELNFNLIEISESNEITVEDSIKIIWDIIDLEYKNLDSLQKTIDSMLQLYKWDSREYKEYGDAAVEGKEYHKLLTKYQTMKKSQPLTIFHVVKYSINNPMLNNVKQEIQKTIYFNPQKTKIYKTE